MSRLAVCSRALTHSYGLCLPQCAVPAGCWVACSLMWAHGRRLDSTPKHFENADRVGDSVDDESWVVARNSPAHFAAVRDLTQNPAADAAREAV